MSYATALASNAIEWNGQRLRPLRKSMGPTTPFPLLLLYHFLYSFWPYFLLLYSTKHSLWQISSSQNTIKWQSWFQKRLIKVWKQRSLALLSRRLFFFVSFESSYIWRKSWSWSFSMYISEELKIFSKLRTQKVHTLLKS